MAFTTAQKIRLEGNLPQEVLDEEITPHINKAAVEIQRLISVNQYNLITTYINPSSSDETRIYNDLVMSETMIALAYLLIAVNITTIGDGIYRVKGWDATRLEMFSFRELSIITDGLRRTAYKILKPYMLSETDEDGNTTLDKMSLTAL